MLEHWYPTGPDTFHEEYAEQLEKADPGLARELFGATQSAVVREHVVFDEDPPAQGSLSREPTLKDLERRPCEEMPNWIYAVGLSLAEATLQKIRAGTWAKSDPKDEKAWVEVAAMLVASTLTVGFIGRHQAVRLVQDERDDPPSPSESTIRRMLNDLDHLGVLRSVKKDRLSYWKPGPLGEASYQAAQRARSG